MFFHFQSVMLSKQTCFLLIHFLSITYITDAYPFFRDRIPNGYNVADPCENGTIWNGVGHQVKQGGGPRNPFGRDFYANGVQYNRTLCEKDSDGDGRTNGEELGDPNCVWTPGNTPSRTEGITHPGICEPLESERCMTKNNWLFCAEFNCTGLDDPDVKKTDYMMPRIEVPAQETTYMCVGVVLPSDKKYHVIADTVILNGSKFVHHVLMYGCTSPEAAEQMTSPVDCLMPPLTCLALFGVWSPGIGGLCLPDDYGFAIGVGGFTHAILQVHLYNPELQAGEYDQTGLTLYYTDKLRKYDGQISPVGQFSLYIPPGQPVVEQVGGCKASCTKYLGDRKLKIVGAAFHMHLIGASSEIHLIYKNGTEIVIDKNDNFSLDKPRLDLFDPYYDFEAGDELKVICRYNSTMRKNVTVWGFSTGQEMCNPIIISIPYTANFTDCNVYKNTPICPLNNSFTYEGCNTEALQPSFIQVGIYCDQTCSPACIDAIRQVNATNCFNLEIGGYIRYFWTAQYPALLPLMQIADYCSARAPPMISSSSPANSGSSQSMASSLNPSDAQGSTMANSRSSAGSGGQSSQGSPGATSTDSGGSGAPGVTTPGEGGTGTSHKSRTIASVLISSLVVGAVAVSIVFLVCYCFTVPGMWPIGNGQRKVAYYYSR